MVRTAAGEARAPERHYNTMSLRDIARLDVVSHAAEDSYLFFWVTGPFLAAGAHVPIMRGWGFEPVSLAFVWMKLNRDWHPRWLTYIESAMWFTGMWYTTRQNAEFVVLGRRGDPPPRLKKNIHQIICAPVREHSRKPDLVYERIEAYADGPYLELFGRQSRPGWTVLGDERDKFDST
jgi:N6-adenosine-specific RNA methylase IME4